MRHTNTVVGLILAATTLAGAATKGAGGQWPQFHGPRRDNLSTETGLLKRWPEGGPKLIWTFAECGRGFAGVAVVDGTLYTVGDFGKDEYVLALDLDGKLLWKTQNGESWRRQYPGARTTPTYDNGTLYHLNPVGRLAAFEAKTGKELWAVDFKEAFGTKYGTWAMAENILIDGDLLLCAPGGERGRVVALEKTTGVTLWANTEIGDTVAYCSPILVDHGGTRQVVTILHKTIVSVEVKTGKLLWTHPHPTQHGQSVTMPIYHRGGIIASSGHGTGTRFLKLSPDGKSVEERWLNKDLDNCHGGLILAGNRLVGAGCRLYKKGLVCVDTVTGKTRWNDAKFGPLSLAYAEGLLYAIDRKGNTSLLKAAGTGCTVVSQFTIPRKGRDLVLCHPVIFGGRLYLRHASNLFAYHIRPGAPK
ncbi:MAG: PQQ-like beta-propeller repeat protein [Candidatus Brocadiae bacterium]|nr:PQQ-like beta-propeller repeat protein [Candidatus Brocadiia bacterium]